MDDEDLWQAYAWPQPCLRANFVVSLDGHIAAENGLSAGLSSPEDRRIFHMLRAGCDAILVGAGTARDENYRPVTIKPEWQPFRHSSASPPLIMVSASGNVPHIEGALTVDGKDLKGVVKQYPRVLCEGGPELFSTILAEGLVDEVALSISGRTGGVGSLLTESIPAHFTPRHVHAADDTVFTLWRRA